jgi:hypothetical protein
MSWEGITAIATSATVFVGLGVPVMIWLLTKPKVHLLNVQPIGWFFYYKGGKDIDGVRFTVQLKLINTGSEKTIINGIFIKDNLREFQLDEPFELDGHGKAIDTTASFSHPYTPDVNVRGGDKIHGILKLQPWGNRRLMVGRKSITAQITIPENQGAHYDHQ